MDNKYYKGIITKHLSGKFQVKLIDNNEFDSILCTAKGLLKHNNDTLYVGDMVSIETSDNSTFVIDKTINRKNSIIRPPLANLSHIFIVIPTINPAPDFLTIDKLISICEFNKIEPIIVINKSDLNKDEANKIANIYNRHFKTFIVSAKNNNSKELLNFIYTTIEEYNDVFISAFAGVSGAGKSSIINSLFPDLNLKSDDLSAKIQRGKNTTRHCELFPIVGDSKIGFLADTPGFSMLDFTRFFFFPLKELPNSFREFVPELSKCKYTDCSHTSEETCGVNIAIKNGFISPSRHDSYLKIYKEIKQTPDWNKEKLKTKK